MHLHLDAIGGVAGDMMVAALLDAFPEHEPGLRASVRAAGLVCAAVAHNDGVLQGRRFTVTPPDAASAHDHHDHSHHHDHGHPHGKHAHRHWSAIRDELGRADLAPAVRAHALAIFGHLAQAEARVHGIAVEDVAFHEVGAWDSIADIVAAAHLIAVIKARSWSVSALPLGSGRVRTRHGMLPVPAPATTLLLDGFATLDDGIPGERVTPTGAAILRHLCGDDPERRRASGRLSRTGIGFGTRTLPGLSNCLRVLAVETGGPDGGHRQLGVIEFEVDDQSAEDLAMGLDRLRAHPDVFDIVQMPVFGKKGRMMTGVRALARADAIEAAVAACFRETTTIGLRHHVVSGAALPRSFSTVSVDGHPVRVKLVGRPGGRTAKAEADDALAHEGHAARARLRREAERLALDAATAEGEEP
ncbi:LarC family nickel insertion protein [Methylobacterium oryzihabitans]|uniref:LarC family nickel insertion protein n=1 Tax=Methylobacterium oryzihabitans TaxID=2499852 RepID=A0A437P7W0_9HYPH|nr:LarC family nickel insertion protein [Methylobacterium oryzihabitans]RVU18178.1 LarC family nickel insertion protein [Methylobacterium oryzihabitans]